MEEKFAKINEFIEADNKDGMLKYMKEHKIKPEDYREDFCYDYPIDRAATFGRLNIFQTLVELGYKVEGIEIHPIYEACNSGYLDLVKALVEVYGVSRSEPDPYGSTPLTCAVQEEHLDVVKYLVIAGASVNERFSDVRFENSTLLHLAVTNISDEICKYLISKGADIEAKDDKGNTPLHTAADENTSDAIVVLLDAGATVDAQNLAGETPFMTALKANDSFNTSTLKLLYQHGADPLVRDSNGKTALHFAMDSHERAYFLLVEVNLCPNSVTELKELFSLALKAKCKETIELLVLLGHVPDGIYDEINIWAQSETEREMVNNVLTMLSKPRGLADLCCFRIRRILGTSLPKVLDCLPVVESVKAFISLSHVPKSKENEYEHTHGAIISPHSQLPWQILTLNPNPNTNYPIPPPSYPPQLPPQDS